MVLNKSQRSALENKIRTTVSSFGGLLDSNWTYINAQTLIDITCKNGHHWKAWWSHLKRGHWCPFCDGQRIDESDVLALIKKRKGKVDDDWKYVNKKTKFWVTCERGHRWSVNYDCLKHKDSWCPYCNHLAIDSNEVKKFILNKGGILKPDWKYTNSTDKFQVTCSKGHSWETSWNVLQSGHWCRECSNIKIIQKNVSRRTDERIVFDFIKKREGKLDQNWKYVNNYQKFWIECKYGHRWKAIWLNLKKGSWCPYCAGKKINEEDIYNYIKNKGGIISKDWKFITTTEKFDITCSNGHVFRSCWDKIRAGHWCPSCYGNNKTDRQKIRDLVKSRGGSLDSDWERTSSYTKFWITCKKGHRWKALWSNINRGHWCPKCVETVSENKFRETIEKVLSSKFPKSKPEWLRNPLTGRLLELDGYNKDLKIAFEYQGPYHYELSPNDDQQKRDRIKALLCSQNKVLLITIPYWVSKKEWEKYIKNQITNLKKDVVK